MAQSKHRMPQWARCEHALRIGSMYTPGMTTDAVSWCADVAVANAWQSCTDLVLQGQATVYRGKVKGLARSTRKIYRWIP